LKNKKNLKPSKDNTKLNNNLGNFEDSKNGVFPKINY
jgi:hypothetical protein